MRRSQQFREDRYPFRGDNQLESRSAPGGPVWFLNPTFISLSHPRDWRRKLEGNDEPTANGRESSVPTDSVTFRYTTRNNRKGRHQIDVVRPKDGAETNYLTPEKTSSIRIVLRGVLKMFIEYPFWDISWLVAWLFTWGSIVWCLNGFFAWLPLERPESEFPGEIANGGGITAFIGATIFEIGSILLLLEAINADRSGCFGWAVEELLEGQPQGKLRLTPANDECHHRHRRRKSAGESPASPQPNIEAGDLSKIDRKREVVEWAWVPSWAELRSHYIYELGFLASAIQALAATIFWIAGFTSLPGIFNNLHGNLIHVYWIPQLVGGSGFIISGFLFMIETQKRWYRPAPKVLGWHIGFWNLIGGIGFTACPAFGYDTASWAQYQAALSTFWGSWAFLIGSVIQLYESLQKHPVDEKKSRN